MSWLGLDIGGANLKAADGRGWARSVPFPLWRDPEGLESALAGLIASAPAFDRVAITMTGELCDAFRTKADGVRHILAASQQAAGQRDVRVYLVDGRLVTVQDAYESPLLAAASNWHALARFACRFVNCRAGLLIDIGSTTTDIVPLVDGQPGANGRNDTDRLLAGELVYTGVGRTPICAITNWLPWRGERCPVAAEVFATAADAYVTLGLLPEAPTDTSTADGRPLTKEFARERLARMICADRATFSHEDAHQAAAAVQEAQVAKLGEALRKLAANMPFRPKGVIVSGLGEFLAIRLAGEAFPAATLVSLADRLGRPISRYAPAHAVAFLAGEVFQGFFTEPG
jgi:probable H4MPT-linked C1 transfer pathway protein